MGEITIWGVDDNKDDGKIVFFRIFFFILCFFCDRNCFPFFFLQLFLLMPLSLLAAALTRQSLSSLAAITFQTFDI